MTAIEAPGPAGAAHRPLAGPGTTARHDPMPVPPRPHPSPGAGR